MKTVTYKNKDGKDIEIQYDENAPCIVCGEPVISASMGGTVICPSCDCGKCRYCGVSVFAMKEELDGGTSKRNVLEHMKWHKKHDPELVKRINNGLRLFSEKLEARRTEREASE